MTDVSVVQSGQRQAFANCVGKVQEFVTVTDCKHPSVKWSFPSQSLRCGKWPCWHFQALSIQIRTL